MLTRSKRFWVLVGSAIVFVIGIYFYKIPPIDLATGISLLTAPYITAETIRKSEIRKN